MRLLHLQVPLGFQMASKWPPLGTLWAPNGLQMGAMAALWDPNGLQMGPLGALWAPSGFQMGSLGALWIQNGLQMGPLGALWSPNELFWSPFGFQVGSKWPPSGLQVSSKCTRTADSNRTGQGWTMPAKVQRQVRLNKTRQPTWSTGRFKYDKTADNANRSPRSTALHCRWISTGAG